MFRCFSYLFFIYFMFFPISPSTAQQKKIVLSSFSVITDITKNIAKNLVVATTMVGPGNDAHEYQITAADAIKIKEADLILCNGLQLEESFMKYFVNLKKDTKLITVTDGITPISMSENANDPYKDPNPHSWVSVKNAAIYIQNISKALKELDPGNAEEYEHNAKEYIQKIEAVLLPLKDRIANLSPEKRWFVTSEGCLVYLARDLDLKVLYLWPVNSAFERSPLKVRDAINQIRKNKIRFVFSESTNSDQPAKQIARDTNASYGGVLYVDTISKSNGPAPTYLDLLKYNLTLIADRLSQ
ncbi:metal ABC transporter solute-binding protein, Zn/Mn family [Candidatus Liberibacter solanacearum]|nr:zinc ABC transporter substrate-binding protein [Candidatus Liberibacter solanacearum]